MNDNNLTGILVFVKINYIPGGSRKVSKNWFKKNLISPRFVTTKMLYIHISVKNLSNL